MEQLDRCIMTTRRARWEIQLYLNIIGVHLILSLHRREQLLGSDHPRRSPRLSQRYSSQPPEMTSSHPLVQSRRCLRPSASVEPASILDESGQSVPPCFYGDMPEQPIKEADGPLHSHTLQHGLPEHLYGMSVTGWHKLYSFSFLPTVPVLIKAPF